MSREIKFRAWDTLNSRMVYEPYFFEKKNNCFDNPEPFEYYEDWRELEDGRSHLCYIMQFTGHKIHEVDLYECDVIREEVETDDGDERSYYIVTWIKEWCMFAALSVNEYFLYQHSVKNLDDSMFWTFPIDEAENGTRRICGNIYQNPELLKPKA